MDVLVNDKEGRFATLVVAVQAADLVETLQGGKTAILNSFQFNHLVDFNSLVKTIQGGNTHQTNKQQKCLGAKLLGS